MIKYIFILVLCCLLVSCGLLKNKNKPETVVGLTWMNKTFTDTIKAYQRGDTVGLLVETKNFKTGKTIDIKLKYKDDESDKPEEEITDSITKTISGVVEADGFARIIIDVEKFLSEE